LERFLNDKSNCNLKAAELLHAHERYAAVPHCAYYACLQQMKHILCVKFQQFCNDNEPRGRNTHVVILDEFIKHTKKYNNQFQKASLQEIIEFEVYFFSLKTYRIHSDYYHSVGCESDNSMKSIELANKIINLIQKIYYD
jgi:hypothetical protein